MTRTRNHDPAVKEIRKKLAKALIDDERSVLQICQDAGVHHGCVYGLIKGRHRSLSLNKMCLLARAVGLRFQLVEDSA